MGNMVAGNFKCGGGSNMQKGKQIQASHIIKRSLEGGSPDENQRVIPHPKKSRKDAG